MSGLKPIHKHKCVYVHIPKCGGRSVEAALEISGNFHQPIKGYCGPADYFKFTFVRNPWDRFVSLYFYFRDKVREPNSAGRGDIRRSNKLRESCNSFCEFSHLPDEWIRKLHPFHFLPQFFWIEHNSTVDMDFIGKCENFQEDFNVVCDEIGIPHQGLPHKNKSKHKHYTEHYDDETRQIVAEKYAKDIEYFGYEFGE